jgi:hypothetical protein
LGGEFFYALIFPFLTANSVGVSPVEFLKAWLKVDFDLNPEN